MKFYAPGKLMISGEYVVLDGATALAIPTPGYGQTMTVTNAQNHHLWQSFDQNTPWFQAVFSKDLKEIIKTSNQSQAVVIQQLLQYIQSQKPILFQQGLHFKTDLNFNRHWGFGSSSTLIALLAQWSRLPAYDLLDKSFGGSGYDVAVALAKKPILYSLQNQVNNDINYRNKTPFWQAVDFSPVFADQLFLVYLNKKQNSRDEIKQYQKHIGTPSQIDEISQISKTLTTVKSLSEFEALLNRHERIISNILQRPTVKQDLFPDFAGSLKSLGAWGGDFILATGIDAPNYFKQKSYTTILNFKNFQPV